MEPPPFHHHRNRYVPVAPPMLSGDRNFYHHQQHHFPPPPPPPPTQPPLPLLYHHHHCPPSQFSFPNFHPIIESGPRRQHPFHGERPPTAPVFTPFPADHSHVPNAWNPPPPGVPPQFPRTLPINWVNEPPRNPFPANPISSYRSAPDWTFTDRKRLVDDQESGPFREYSIDGFKMNQNDKIFYGQSDTRVSTDEGKIGVSTRPNSRDAGTYANGIEMGDKEITKMGEFNNGVCNEGSQELVHIPKKKPKRKKLRQLRALQRTQLGITTPWKLHSSANSDDSSSGSEVPPVFSNQRLEEEKCRKMLRYVCSEFEATGICPQGSMCKLLHPKNPKMGKKSNRSKKNKKKRYFGSTLTDATEKVTVASNKPAVQNDGNICFQEGKFVDYISLD